MKVSKLWLQEWVDVTLSEQELAHQLTMAGLEVDALSPVAGAFTQVVVAKVLSTKPHPDADKLTLCDVSIADGQTLKIVCGAKNVRPGLKVALAMIGSQLPGGFTIKESKLRGELSQGMLCSAVELGLADQSEGILELAEDAPIGADLREYLSLDDQVFDINVTPNRADCFSVLGIARELSALNTLPLKPLDIEAIAPKIDDVLAIELGATEACPRYCGQIIRNINTQAVTPLWMSERIRRSGIRVHHPVVDIINYVMLELGQPMHAFNLAQLKGSITIRFSNKMETLELLDGQKITLNDKVLVIADQEKPVAMAGIMGGAQTSVQSDTCDLFLESAYFNPIIIAGVARSYGLFSDSCQRFERGVDPYLQRKALERATSLIVSICGGDPAPIVEASSIKDIPEQKTVSFDTKKVEKVTGVTIAEKEITRLLEGIGMTILQNNHGVLDVKVPTHRFDIQYDVDLVEEVIRLYGYNNLKAQPMHSLIQVSNSNATETVAKKLALWFRDRGYNETISYSFVDPELQQALYPQHEYMQLLNPISPELSQMRTGMWPGLIASMIYNTHRQQNEIKFFEIGVVFDVEGQELKERTCIAGLLMGEQGGAQWCEPTRCFDFFDLKGDLQSIFSLMKISDIHYVPASHNALHPGQSAQIIVNGKPAGWIGVLHPKLMDALDLQYDVIVFEIDLAALEPLSEPRYKSISKYPQIRRDLSFLVDKPIQVMEIEQVIKACIQERWLKSFDVFDVYTGTGVPDDKKSLAVSMTLQDENRTLVDSEINSLISAIISALQHEFSITLRE